MSLPIFYIDKVPDDAGILELNEENSRHVAQVLRMQAGERIALTNGRGLLLNCELTDNHKKKCRVNIRERTFTKRQSSGWISINVG